MTRLLVALVAAAGVAVVASRASLLQGPPPGVKLRATAHCSSIIEVSPAPQPGGNEQVLWRRVAVPRYGSAVRPTRLPGRRSLPYWWKAGLLIHRGRSAVDLAVRAAWRGREAIGWGDAGPASSVRVLGCGWSGADDWLPYAGGFTLRTPDCVPLIVRNKGRSTTIWLPLGRRCPPRGS
jgi:hypothetical protein